MDRYRMDLLADGTVLVVHEAPANRVQVDGVEVVQSYDLDRAEHDRLAALPPLAYDTDAGELVALDDKKKKPIKFKGELKLGPAAADRKLRKDQNAVLDPEDSRSIDSL